jgi:hypothetical protein
MGLSENPANAPPNQETPEQRWRPQRLTRRPRTRRCLLKGCERRYRPRRGLQRYCSYRCREAARAWSRWKAQERYRATAAGQEKRRAQSQRYRERVRRRKEQALEAAEATARVISTDFFRGLVRPAWLLREFRAEPEIPTATVLFEGVSAGSGARLGAGAALARAAGRVRTDGNAMLPTWSMRFWPRARVAPGDRLDILTDLRRSISFSLSTRSGRGTEGSVVFISLSLLQPPWGRGGAVCAVGPREFAATEIGGDHRALRTLSLAPAGSGTAMARSLRHHRSSHPWWSVGAKVATKPPKWTPFSPPLTGWDIKRESPVSWLRRQMRLTNMLPMPLSLALAGTNRVSE